MHIELTLENIESLLKDKSINYNICKVFKNDEFYCSFEFDKNGEIIKIIDDEDNSAKYLYSDSGIITLESIIINNNKVDTYYKLEKDKTIISEYITRKFIQNKKINGFAASGYKYRFGNISNKYLAKYNLDNLKTLYLRGEAYTIKCLDNGFEVYYDEVMVYKELYNELDQLIKIFIVDYNCITNTFKYNKKGQVIEQLIYCNRDIAYKINYKYYLDSDLLKQEIINNDKIYYYYNSDTSISKIFTEYDEYDFIYN